MYRFACANTLSRKYTEVLKEWWREVSTSAAAWNQSGVNLFRFKLRNARTPDAVQSPRLTPQMVNSILRMNEESVDVVNGPVKAYVKNQLQANKPIEDRNGQGSMVHGTASMFGVFDGHAGCACAQAVRDRLFSYIAVAMADHSVLKEIRDGTMDPTTDLIHWDGDNDRLVQSDLAALHKKSLVTFATECMAIDSHDVTVKESLVNGFLRLDRDITNEASPSNLHRPSMDMSCYFDTLAIAFSGAVGCVAYVDGTDLFVANVGDTQAVLGVLSDNRWEAVSLSNTHNADNPGEVERITRFHPNESSNIIKNRRLFGELVPLRSFGDVRYKWVKSDLLHLLNTKQIPNHLLSIYGESLVPPKYRTPPYLDAEPEVMHHHLTPKDKFLVLASDGLWDCLSPEKVVQLVAGHMDGQQVLVNYTPSEGATLKAVNTILTQRRNSLKNRALDSNAATHLLRSALGPDHGQISAQLTLPETIVRFYRDDITIVIIYFDSDYIKDRATFLR
ncbi:pyruvate dehydrogenase [acetyl-transferring]-phosphatase 1, mitochondrial-like [Babylonia areolata]|uniref:pyruvate dehydrogenase [acetyl-transferring]-phosphatase 1, mitochondrial-like n=1 Tax=Babylonia areolata TaxID=304850 RepID=UPI003FD230EE